MLRALLATVASLLLATVCFAGDKQVSFETIPPGAEVEVNGSIVCTTPCAINVPSYYFGAKRTAFARHGETPITVRLTRAGYLTKTIEITTGPIHWHNLNGVNVYDYYLVSNTSYTSADSGGESDGLRLAPRPRVSREENESLLHNKYK
jgi:hypothetical protein